MTTERPEPPLIADEREMLRAFLDFHRATLAMKCDGLSDEDLRRRSMPPSTLTLLGLVRHMAEVERTWFRRVINGEDVPLVWSATAASRRPPYAASSLFSRTGPVSVAAAERKISMHRGCTIAPAPSLRSST